MGKKPKYYTFASQMLAKDGESKYIKVTSDVNIPKGSTIFVNSPQENIKRLASSGIISEEEAESRISRVPSYVLKELTVKFPDDSEN